MNDDAAALRKLAEQPENKRLMGVLCYCADRIASLSSALEGTLALPQDTERDCAIGEAAEGVLRRGGRLEAAEHEFPAALIGGPDAYARREANFNREREKRRRKVELELLGTLFREHFGERLTPQITAMLDEAYIGSNLAEPPLAPWEPVSQDVRGRRISLRGQFVDPAELHGDTEAAYIRQRIEQLKHGGEL